MDMQDLPMGTVVTVIRRFRAHGDGRREMSGQITRAWMSPADTVGGSERFYGVMFADGTPDAHATVRDIVSVDTVGRGMRPTEIAAAGR